MRNHKHKHRNVSPDFEERWKRRFGKYADYHDDDAGIAGWSRVGLEVRFRYFSDIWEKAHRASPGGQAWLDAGCGAGTYTRFLAARGCRVAGLDYSFGSIKKARARSDGQIVWFVGDVRQLPVEPASLDGVISFGVVQALSDSEELVQQLAISVADGGEVWVDALNAWCLPNLWDIVKRRLRRQTLHVRYESPWRLRRLFLTYGLTDVDVHWVLIVPARFGFLARIADSSLMRILLARVPGMGPLLCHSILVRGRKKVPVGK